MTADLAADIAANFTGMSMRIQDKLKDGRIERWQDGRMTVQKNGRMAGWQDGRMEVRV